MEKRVCTRCLLRDMIEAGDSMEMIEKYRAAIKEADRVTEEIYESRLSAAMWSCAQWQPCHGARRRSGSAAAVSAARRSGSRRTAVVGET